MEGWHHCPLRPRWVRACVPAQQPWEEGAGHGGEALSGARLDCKQSVCLEPGPGMLLRCPHTGALHVSPTSHSLVCTDAFSKSMEGAKGVGTTSIGIQGLCFTSPSALCPGAEVKRPWMPCGVGKASDTGWSCPQALGVWQ